MMKSWSQRVVRLVDADVEIDTIDAVARTSLPKTPTASTPSLCTRCLVRAHDRFDLPGSRPLAMFSSTGEKGRSVCTVCPPVCNLERYSRLISLRLVSVFGPLYIAQLFLLNTIVSFFVLFCFFGLFLSCRLSAITGIFSPRSIVLTKTTPLVSA